MRPVGRPVTAGARPTKCLRHNGFSMWWPRARLIRRRVERMPERGGCPKTAAPRWSDACAPPTAVQARTAGRAGHRPRSGPSTLWERRRRWLRHVVAGSRGHTSQPLHGLLVVAVDVVPECRGEPGMPGVRQVRRGRAAQIGQRSARHVIQSSHLRELHPPATRFRQVQRHLAGQRCITRDSGWRGHLRAYVDLHMVTRHGQMPVKI